MDEIRPPGGRVAGIRPRSSCGRGFSPRRVRMTFFRFSFICQSCILLCIEECIWVRRYISFYGISISRYTILIIIVSVRFNGDAELERYSGPVYYASARHGNVVVRRTLIPFVEKRVPNGKMIFSATLFSDNTRRFLSLTTMPWIVRIALLFRRDAALNHAPSTWWSRIR